MHRLKNESKNHNVIPRLTRRDYRWGAPFTQVVTSKGETPKNRLWETDLSGTAPRRYLPDPDRINEVWQRPRGPINVSDLDSSAVCQDNRSLDLAKWCGTGE